MIRRRRRGLDIDEKLIQLEAQRAMIMRQIEGHKMAERDARRVKDKGRVQTAKHVQDELTRQQAAVDIMIRQFHTLRLMARFEGKVLSVYHDMHRELAGMKVARGAEKLHEQLSDSFEAFAGQLQQLTERHETALRSIQADGAYRSMADPRILDEPAPLPRFEAVPDEVDEGELREKLSRRQARFN